MIKLVTTMILSCLVAVAGFAQIINNDKSVVNFKVKNMKIKTVKGTFTGMKGTVNFSPSNIASSNFDVCIDASTVNTKNEKRDNHLRNADFFDTDKYPTICFKSKSITNNADTYLVKGTLTMHGISKEVEIPFTFSNNILKGNLTLQRLDYQIGESTGEFMVGNNIEIEIICVLN